MEGDDQTMLDPKRKLAENVRSVMQRIEQACADAGRPSSSVQLIAVTKYVGLDLLRIMPDAGLMELAESRPQELTKRAAAVNEFLSRRPRDAAKGAVQRPRWHLVGHLQRNKVKMMLPWVDMIHSVDSLRLAEEIDAVAAKLERRIDVLMEVNAGGEPQKQGVAVGAATHLAEHIATLPQIRLCGLMTMAPLTDDPVVSRDCFVRCRELFEEIRHEVRVGDQFRQLSMGMSGDFEIAIAQGATMVRIGSALYEGLSLPAEAAEASASSEVA